MDLLKVKLIEDPKVVQETTNRMGIANKRKKILFPSCYLYEKDGETYLVHFKQLFSMRDDGYDNVCEEDIKRRNAIAFCLKNWGLIDVADEDIEPHDIFIFVLRYEFKHEWTINHKVNLFTLNN